MAEESFSGLNEQSIKNAQKINLEIGEIQGSFTRINKTLGTNASLLRGIRNSFNEISTATDKVAILQEKAKNSTEGTAKALQEQQKQLNIVRNLNAQIDILYARAEDSSGATKVNLKTQAQNLADARDRANQLANIFGDIVEDSAKLDKSTLFFSKMSEVLKGTPILKSFAGPFEAASKAARQTVLDNAKIASIKETIAGLDARERDYGGGLTKEKLKQLGLSEITKNLEFKAAGDALKNYQAVTKQSNVLTSGLSAGFKSIGEGVSGFFKGGGWIGLLITGAIELFKFIKDAMFAADNRITNIAKSLSISKENATGVYDSLTNLKGSLDTIYATTGNIVAAFNEVSTATDFIGVATKDQIETQIILTKNLGLQVDEAQKLQGLFAANNMESSEGVDIVYDQVAAFAKENKLLASGAKTLKEIQNTSKLILINFKGNVGELTKTILEAKKLGLSLDQVNKVAGSLLNFEESISAELEAELLLGRDINLEQARLFALNNDIAGVTREIANQGITIESFSRMNRIQQEAIAKTLGMQAEELGTALYNAQVIEKLGGRDLEQKREAAKKQREIAEASGDAKKIAEAMNAEATIASIEKQILTGKELAAAERSVSVQEKFNALLERAKEIFSDVFTGERLDAFANGLERFIKAIESGRSLMNIFFFGLDNAEESNQKNIEESQEKERKTATARSRFYGGPEYQKKMKKLYGPSGIPSEKKDEEEVAAFKFGGIVTKPTLGLIGEAGHEGIVPLDKFYAKIDEFIQVQQNTILAIKEGTSATKEGKNIYFDSYRVNTAQNIAATKT